MSTLALWQTKMEHMVTMTAKSYEYFSDRRHSSGESFNTSFSSQEDINFVRWIASCQHLPINSNFDDFHIPSETSSSSPSSHLNGAHGNNAVSYNKELVDEYGWIFLDGKFYIVETNTFEDKHPCTEQ